jgi:hypothetical protein
VLTAYDAQSHPNRRSSMPPDLLVRGSSGLVLTGAIQA